MSYIAKNGRLYTSGASEALTLLDDKFSVNKSYSKGDSCIYNDYLWKFTSDKTAGEWDSSVVEQCRVMDFVDDVNQIQSQIVPTASIESGATASKAYSVGEYLVKDGTLYKVTKNITKDDALTVGTNIVITTIGGELSEKSNLTYNKLDDASYVGSDAEDYFRLAKIGNIVFVTFRKTESTPAEGKITIKKLPTELIPKNEQMFYFVIHSSSFIPGGVVKNDGYLYSKSGNSWKSIASEFFYFLD